MPSFVLETLLIAYARNFPIRRGKMRVIDALWRRAVGGDTRRIAKLRSGGMKMTCDLNEMLQRQYYFFGTYFLESEILDCWAAAAEQAEVIFDVGASSGIYGLEALAAHPRAVVHAFEPTPEIAERLRQTARLNELDRLHVHECAVSDTDGQASLHRFRGETGTNEGMNYITADSEAGAERVPTVRLDSFCTSLGVDRIDLLKLDIQGNESAALEGAGRLIAERRVGAIFIELNWSPEGDCPAERSIKMLADAGYVFAKPVKHPAWRSAGPWLKRLSDVMARPGQASEASSS